VEEIDPTKHHSQMEADKGRKRKERRLVSLDQLIKDTENKWVNKPSLNESIAKAVKQAKRYLYRTQVSDDGLSCKTHVCIICDCFILGTDSIRYLCAAVIKLHKHCIVKSYAGYYKTTLPE